MPVKPEALRTEQPAFMIINPHGQACKGHGPDHPLTPAILSRHKSTGQGLPAKRRAADATQSVGPPMRPNP